MYITIAELLDYGFAITADVYAILSGDLYVESEPAASK